MVDILNIICVKWGTKYTSEEVNKLFTNINENLSISFIFTCFTDDPLGLSNNITPVIIPKNYNLDGYWNKLALFEQDRFKGTNLYFDLDIYIQHPIDELLNYLTDDLTVIKAYWKDGLVTDGSVKQWEHRWNMDINSSVMLWRGNSLAHIWRAFYNNPEYYMLQYKGIDRFVYHEGFKLNYFPEGMIYSRFHGCYTDTEKEIPFRKIHFNQTPSKLVPEREIYLYELPTALVCLYNGPCKHDWMKLVS